MQPPAAPETEAPQSAADNAKALLDGALNEDQKLELEAALAEANLMMQQAKRKIADKQAQLAGSLTIEQQQSLEQLQHLN